MAEYINSSLKESGSFADDTESDVKQWITSITGHEIGDDGSLADALKSGVILCELINKIEPGTIQKIDDSKTHFKQMENIKRFLRACRSFGMKEHDVFETIDLYEQKDMRAVVRCLLALRRSMRNEMSSRNSSRLWDLREQVTIEPSKSTRETDEEMILLHQIYDAEAIDELVLWMETILGVSKDIPPSALAQCLKDGIILCNLINSIKPGSIPRVNNSDLPYKQRENITGFLKACIAFGVKDTDMCDLNDIFEEKNTHRVLRCLFALGKAIQATFPEFKGPKLRPDIVKGTMDGNKAPKPDDELIARQFIAIMTGKTIKEGKALTVILQDGIILCELMNAIVPGSIPRIDESKMPFKQMENIKRFLSACRSFGLMDSDLFETNDLYDGK
eukprot:gene9333-19375_t